MTIGDPSPAEVLIYASIYNAKTTLACAKVYLRKRTPEDADFDVLIQIVKDNENFIQEQEHTLALIRDGMI